MVYTIEQSLKFIDVTLQGITLVWLALIVFDFIV
jgi:hypothetical protein